MCPAIRPECNVKYVNIAIGGGSIVGAFSVIVKTGCGTDGAFHSTNHNIQEEQCTQGGWLDTLDIDILFTIHIDIETFLCDIYNFFYVP